MWTRLAIACAILSGVNVFAQEKKLSPEDLLIAELKLIETNHTTPEAIATYPTHTLGIDPRVNKVVEEKYVCDDLCPAYGSLFLNYRGVATAAECIPIGQVMRSPGWQGYAGCRPNPFAVSIVLRSKETIEDVYVLGKTPLFIRVGKIKSPGSSPEGDATPVYTESSYLLSDIAGVRAREGGVLQRFGAALAAPALDKDPRVVARIYLDEARRYMQPASYWYYHINAEPFILLVRAIELDPQLQEAYLPLADFTEKTGSSYIKEAAAVLERALTKNKSSYELYYALGQVYAALWNVLDYRDKSLMNKSIAMLTKAIEFKPDLADAYWRLAKYHANVLDDYANAVKYYEEWIRIAKLDGARLRAAQEELAVYRSSLARPTINRARSLRRQKKYDEAIKEYQAALLCAPDSLEALYGVGLAYKRKGDIAEATEVFNKLALREADVSTGLFNAKAYAQLGLIYKKQGDARAAREYFEKAKGIYRSWIQKDPLYKKFQADIDKIDTLISALPQQ